MAGFDHYLLIVRYKTGDIGQVLVEVDPDNAHFASPIRCCASGSGKLFWRNYLREHGIDAVSKVTPIKHFINYRAVGSTGN